VANSLRSQVIENVALNLIRNAVIYLPPDVKAALQKAQAEEPNGTAKTQLKAILDNVELAERLQAPMCQDTGIITFYVKAGAKAKNLDLIEKALVDATRLATREIPLRPNAVNPFTEKNSNDNTGRYVPNVEWEIVHGDSLELTVVAKGGGSENVSALAMLNPSEGLNGVKKAVVNAVIKAGAKPCPPTILGVAVGGGADIAMKLAKNALLRPLDEANSDPVVARLEQDILVAVNTTGIGPMGLGGKTTVLGVHVDYAYRHPASFPVAIAFSCWADRHASARINAEDKVEYLTHKEQS
jgi:fumarate hydratase subunit alpha